MAAENERKRPKLEEARRRWGEAEVIQGDARQFTPAPAIGAAHEDRRAA